MNFDLTKTTALNTLFAVPREKRDANWVKDFYANADEASMESMRPQVFDGPDGFKYFGLKLPAEGVEIEPFCVNHVLDFCLERGAGVAMFGTKAEPEWVFTYGDLWSKKIYGEFRVPTPQSKGGEEILQEQRSVFAGQPAESYLPVSARKVLASFMERLTCMQDRKPQVMLLMDATQPEPRSLVFNIFATDFPAPEYRDQVMQLLTWFIPSHYILTGVEANSPLVSHFADLVP